MKIEIHNRVSDFSSYRAARVKSLFNAESGCNFDFEVDADLSGDWQIGVVVGPSGSGKSSIGKVIFGDNLIHDYTKGWHDDRPIIDDIAPDGDFNEVTGALANVGLGDVPAWLRPFRVLSNGEQFRAGLARLIVSRPERVVVDEFTSVIDRQIARIGSQAFQKSWRRTNPGGKVVLLTPHYDIVDWVQPDWVLDTKTRVFDRGRRRQRPRFDLEVWKVDQSYWRYFKPHYYLDLPMPPCAEYFVGTVDGELACHVAVAPRFEVRGYRATRLVTMPEWQGAGVGWKFLNWIAQYHLEGWGRGGRRYVTYFHTSHPQLCGALRHSRMWVQCSAVLYGGNKTRSRASILAAHKGGGGSEWAGAAISGPCRASSTSGTFSRKHRVRRPLPRHPGLQVRWRPRAKGGRDVRVFIYGQRSFGLAVLKELHGPHEVVGVAVAPHTGTKKDKMVGYALLKGVPIFGDMERMTADRFPDDVDLVVSAHSHWMISDAVLSKARHGGIGYHPSLLPRHRGQDAVRWQVHMGDPVVGGTIYRLGPVCDGGDVLLQRWRFRDPSWSHHDLWRELFPEGVRMVREAVDLIAAGRDGPLWREQDERFATWEPSWDRPRLRRNDLMMLE